LVDYVTPRKEKERGTSVRAIGTCRTICAVRYHLTGLVFATILASALPSFAQYDQGDGAYGRLNGDTILSYGAGFGLGFNAKHTFAADLRARYLDSAGVIVAPEIRTNGEPAIAVAVEVRPLFLGKFLTGHFSGRSWLDLTVDSLGVEVGSWFGPLDEGTGAAFLVGGGVDLPLGADGSSGLWMRLGARWIYAHERDLGSPEAEGRASKVFIMAVLYFRSAVDLGIASWEPRSYTPP
jgi:hypothetical protein